MSSSQGGMGGGYGGSRGGYGGYGMKPMQQPSAFGGDPMKSAPGSMAYQGGMGGGMNPGMGNRWAAFQNRNGMGQPPVMSKPYQVQGPDVNLGDPSQQPQTAIVDPFRDFGTHTAYPPLGQDPAKGQDPYGLTSGGPMPPWMQFNPWGQ